VGIDIPGVDYVINYDLPDKAENYVHRVGRTGRGKQKGQALAFCSPREEEMLQEIETFLGHPIEELLVDKLDHADTLALSEEKKDDWRSLMKEIEVEEQEWKKKKRKRRK
jgi:ATP-dependent RNA helicase RhlE